MSHSHDLSNKMITVNSNQLTQKAKEFSVQNIKSEKTPPISNTQQAYTEDKPQTEEQINSELKNNSHIIDANQPIKELNERNSSSEKQDSRETKKKTSSGEQKASNKEAKD